MRVRTAAKRRDIMETAAAVFLEQGFARASMSGIATRLGGYKTTLYGYFRSKEELDEKSPDLRDALLPVAEKLVAVLLRQSTARAIDVFLSAYGT